MNNLIIKPDGFNTYHVLEVVFISDETAYKHIKTCRTLSRSKGFETGLRAKSC